MYKKTAAYKAVEREFNRWRLIHRLLRLQAKPRTPYRTFLIMKTKLKLSLLRP